MKIPAAPPGRRPRRLSISGPVLGVALTLGVGKTGVPPLVVLVGFCTQILAVSESEAPLALTVTVLVMLQVVSWLKVLFEATLP